MSGLTDLQKTRLASIIRDMKRSPEWQDLKRFLVAAKSPDSESNLDEVANDIKRALVVAVEAEK